jgi:hypothetical protein
MALTTRDFAPGDQAKPFDHEAEAVEELVHLHLGQSANSSISLASLIKTPLQHKYIDFFASLIARYFLAHHYQPRCVR